MQMTRVSVDRCRTRRISVGVIWALLLIALSAPVACADDKLDLRLSFHKGDTQQVSVSLDQVVNQTVRQVHQQTSQKIAIGYTFTVSDIDPAGVATLIVRYHSASFHAKTPAGPVDYDSAKPPAQAPMMASGLAAMVGQSFSLKLTPAGQVTQVDGLDAMMKTVLGKMNVPEGPAKVAAEKSLRQQLSAENIKSNLQNVFAPFPDHPVSVGDSWTRSTQVTIGCPMLVQNTYTLKQRKDGVVSIDMTGKAATLANSVIDLGQVKMQYDLQGDQTGTVQILESTGWTRSAEIDQKLSGKATVQSPNGPAQQVLLEMQSSMKTDAR